MRIYETPLVIKETYLDIFGHMNNAKYLELFEQARWDAIVPKGFTVEYIRKSKTGPVILEVQVKFMHELTARETITMTVELAEYNGKVGKIKQQMIKADGKVACEAFFTFGLMDLAARKLIAPTEEWRKALSI